MRAAQRPGGQPSASQRRQARHRSRHSSQRSLPLRLPRPSLLTAGRAMPQQRLRLRLPQRRRWARPGLTWPSTSTRWSRRGEAPPLSPLRWLRRARLLVGPSMGPTGACPRPAAAVAAAAGVPRAAGSCRWLRSRNPPLLQPLLLLPRWGPFERCMPGRCPASSCGPPRRLTSAKSPAQSPAPLQPLLPRPSQRLFLLCVPGGVAAAASANRRAVGATT